MSQYKPMHRAPRIPLLARKITVAEHETVLRLLTDLGIENGWVQEMGAAEEYLPDFEREGHPFSPAFQGREESISAKLFPDRLAQG
jgi:putative pyruvate formate lyase activating enzyme